MSVIRYFYRPIGVPSILPPATHNSFNDGTLRTRTTKDGCGYKIPSSRDREGSTDSKGSNDSGDSSGSIGSKAPSHCIATHGVSAQASSPPSLTRGDESLGLPELPRTNGLVPLPKVGLLNLRPLGPQLQLQGAAFQRFASACKRSDLPKVRKAGRIVEQGAGATQGFGAGAGSEAGWTCRPRWLRGPPRGSATAMEANRAC